MSKSQTATEYLIILAVVIVIALIVVGVLGGIPSIGGGASESSIRVQLKTLDVGVDNYLVDSKYALLKLSNNNPFAIIITNITINNTICVFPETRLKQGEAKNIGCYGFKSFDDGVKFRYPITITYKDTLTDAIYTINDSTIPLVGTVASGNSIHTGQTSCTTGDSGSYTTCTGTHAGQDGYEDGTAKSFSDLGNNVFLDELTELHWTANASWGNLAFAQTYCNGLSQGDYSDWRVPSILELMAVVDYQTSGNPRPSPALWETGSDYFWSSTNQETSQYWQLRSDNGSPRVHRVSSSTGMGHIVCVRGLVQGISLSDDEVEFIDNKDGTITDPKLGVIWEKDLSNTSVMGWSNATIHCNNLVKAGYSDWRLPTAIEGVGLFNFKSESISNYFPSDFLSTSYDRYWTSTTVGGFNTGAYILITDEARTWSVNKDFNSLDRARCVRS